MPRDILHILRLRTDLSINHGELGQPITAIRQSGGMFYPVCTEMQNFEVLQDNYIDYFLIIHI